MDRGRSTAYLDGRLLLRAHLAVELLVLADLRNLEDAAVAALDGDELGHGRMGMKS